MTVRVTCINKDGGNRENPHAAISHLGWLEDGTGKTGKSTRLEMYDWIKNQNGKAYVSGANGATAWVGTAETARGTKYVRTYRDNTWTDNLLRCQNADDLRLLGWFFFAVADFHGLATES